MEKEERISAMSSMIRMLRERQKLFEVLSDEEFYNSSYGSIRREKGYTADQNVFFHVLFPGLKRDLFKVYFLEKRVAIALCKLLGDNLESLNTSVSYSKARPKDRYWEVNVYTESPDEALDKGLQLSLDLMRLATVANPDFGPWQESGGINTPLPPKDILKANNGEFHYICGRCGHEYLKAPRCPECGQLVKE